MEYTGSYTIKVQVVLPDLDAMESLIWNFHVYDLKGTNRYGFILGYNTYSKINKDLCLSDNNIKGKGCNHKVYTAPMKEMLKNSLNLSFNWLKQKYFITINCECHTAYTLNPRCSLQKYDLHKFTPEKKQLS